MTAIITSDNTQERNETINRAFRLALSKGMHAYRMRRIALTPQTASVVLENAAIATAKSFNTSPEEVKRISKAASAAARTK